MIVKDFDSLVGQAKQSIANYFAPKAALLPSTAVASVATADSTVDHPTAAADASAPLRKVSTSAEEERCLVPPTKRHSDASKPLHHQRSSPVKKKKKEEKKQQQQQANTMLHYFLPKQQQQHQQPTKRG